MAEFEELLARLKRQKENAEAVLLRLNKAIELLEQAKELLGPEELRKFIETMPEQPTMLLVSKRERGVLPPDEIAAAVKSTLKQVGHPLKRGELVRELEKRNIPLAGKDKNKNLGTLIWRRPDEFVSLENLGYWIKGEPIPGIYDPDE